MPETPTASTNDTNPFTRVPIEITVSGTDVAAAVMVKAMMIGETWRISAKCIDASVKKYVATPIAMIVHPEVKSCGPLSSPRLLPPYFTVGRKAWGLPS